MSRRTKRNGEGGGQSVCVPPPHYPYPYPYPNPPMLGERERERYYGGVSTAPTKKALFDFLLWDLLSLLKRLIGSINFEHTQVSYKVGGVHGKHRREGKGSWIHVGEGGQLQRDLGYCTKKMHFFGFYAASKIQLQAPIEAFLWGFLSFCCVALSLWNTARASVCMCLLICMSFTPEKKWIIALACLKPAA